MEKVERYEFTPLKSENILMLSILMQLKVKTMGNSQGCAASGKLLKNLRNYKRYRLLLYKC